jgi:hypothetical protein
MLEGVAYCSKSLTGTVVNPELVIATCLFVRDAGTCLRLKVKMFMSEGVAYCSKSLTGIIGNSQRAIATCVFIRDSVTGQA